MSIDQPCPFVIQGKLLAPESMRTRPFASGFDKTAKGIAP